MKIFTKSIYIVLVILTAFFGQSLKAQSVLDPNDPVITYDPNNPPATPPYGQIGKWVRTKRLNWNTDQYKAYYYKGCAFRLLFPKSYNPTANDGKTYPMIIMFHGAGEAGPPTDNEYSMYHGGQPHLNAVNNGQFDGFVFFMQGGTGWGDPRYTFIAEIIDYMVANNKLDPFRVSVHGLSAGGEGAWNMAVEYPTYVADALPMSGTQIGYKNADVVQSLKYMPIWDFQGGLDGSPAPATSLQVYNAFVNAGGNYKHTVYPDLGHGTWDRAYAEADFFPFMLRAHKANPWALGGRTDFCPGDVINITLGVTAGFNAYQWMKGSTVINGANSNTLQVTDTGTYYCRIQRGSLWSPWSPTPAVVRYKGATVSPPIQISGVMSNVLPTPDSTPVTLSVPDSYATYQWQKVGSSTTLGTSNTLNVSAPGDYRVKVTEQYGCSSDFSAPFTVVDANGPNKPDAAIGLAVTTLGKTSLKLNWSDNPNPVYDETNFEVYQSTSATGPFHLVHIKGANVLSDTISGLTSGTTYYYKVRAVNNTAAAGLTPAVSGTTGADTQAPTAPNLSVAGTSRSSVSLKWDAATDDVGVTGYDIYVNGQKAYTVGVQSNFTVYNLTYGKSYNFTVKAKDFANNISPFSNQVTAEPLNNGLDYKYYTFPNQTWNNLANFNTLVPIMTGNTPNVDISVSTEDDNFAFLWTGFITIPTTGNYKFRTNSDDGSKLWLGQLGSQTSPYSFTGGATTTLPGLLVNNDGLHGAQDKTSSTIRLTAGVYPIAIAFYEQGGGQSITVSWSTPSNSSFVPIPSSAFADQQINNGSAPSAPSNLQAVAQSYNKIKLTWNDNSSNETGFEIWRSTDQFGTFATVATVPANATSYVDSGLNGSTTYYYKMIAIGRYGQSAFSDAGPGVDYSYYEVQGLSAMPDFNSLTPVRTGRWANFDLNLPHQEDNFQLKFSGKIYISKAGKYTFYTTSDDGSQLYIDGFTSSKLVVNNNYVQGPTERSGTTGTLSVGYHDIYVTFFEVGGGQTLEVRYQGPSGSGISKQLIPNSVLGTTLPQATTLPLPAVPQQPTGFTASGISPSAISVTWTDVATNEDKYELYRSAVNNGSYSLLTTLPANTTSYKDSGLFSNSVFYYKVRAVNVGGASAYSTEDSASSFDNLPVIAALGDKSAHYGTSVQVQVSATDADPENVTLSFPGLPGFGSFVSTGNGAGTLTFNPTQADQGTYTITVQATDQHNGTSTKTFTLAVNDNYNPVIATVNNVSVNENQTSQVSISASDANASDALTWSFSGLPSFATVTTNGGTAQISLAPGYADNGSYTVTANISDGHSGTDAKTFTITVNDVNPNKKIYINFNDGTAAAPAAPAPWNNTNKNPVNNDNFPALKDETGTATAIGFQVTSNWQAVGAGTNTGVNTGNNSGIYPDVVMQSFWYTNTSTQTMKVYGLDPNNRYNFTFFGSRIANLTDNRITYYTIGSTTVQLNCAQNTQNTVSINNVTPNPDGTLIVSLSKNTGSPYGYLNAMTVQGTIYNDGNAPAKPRSLAAQYSNGVQLTWVDAAYNETGYEVYRATDAGGPYTLLNPGGLSGMQAYTDTTTASGTTYYYAVAATNAAGRTYSDTVSLLTPNNPPAIATIGDQTAKSDLTTTVNIAATDATGDVITLNVTGLPSFASFSQNGNGTGALTLTPTLNNLGTYQATVIATDNHGASSSKTFGITVVNKDLKNIYINFNDGSGTMPAQAAPWNNMNGTPTAGRSLASLKDEDGTTTTATLTMVEAWTGANAVGTVTGNNSGIYPDNVMKSCYYDQSGTVKHINITGLSTTKLYNLVFFASRTDVNDNRITQYTVGSQTVQLNAASNTTQTVAINSISPDANGQIQITIVKDPGSSFAYINALVIQSYPADLTVRTPSNPDANGISTSSIRVNWTGVSPNVTTGFEVWRSSSPTGTFTQVGTVTGATANTYTDNGLAASTFYYYKVRAVGASGSSPYTDVVGASTVAYSVLLNVNDGSVTPPQPGNWNNTSSLPSPGFTLSNMIDDNGLPTGISWTIVRNFSAYNSYGVVTGNNSGVVPDNVMKGFYYIENGDSAILMISNLSLMYSYSFDFLASRANPSNNVISTYRINDQSVALNAGNNSTNLAIISGIRPDSLGRIFITIYSHNFGYLNYMAIHAAPSIDLNAVGSGTQSGQTVSRAVTTASSSLLSTDSTNSLQAQNEVSAFPNPFVDDITVSLNLTQPADKLVAMLVDMSGRVVFSRQLSSVPQGVSVQRLGIDGSRLPAGVYLLRVAGLPGSNSAMTIKVVKALR